MNAVVHAVLDTPGGEVRVALVDADICDFLRNGVLERELADQFDVLLYGRKMPVGRTVLVSVRDLRVVDGAIGGTGAVVGPRRGHAKCQGACHEYARYSP